MGLREKNHFCPQNDKFGCILTLFNRQKTRTVTRSLGARILRSSRERKLTETVQKLTKVRPKGAVAPPPSP